LRAEADQVLAPYAELLTQLTPERLMRGAAERMTAAAGVQAVARDAPVASDWYVESTPVFAFTQDQTALVLANQIAIVSKRAPKVVAFLKDVRVISSAVPNQDPCEEASALWLLDDGARLKTLTVEMLARSFDIAVSDLLRQPSDTAPVQKTVRYMEGMLERIERAELIEQDCEQRLVRTLRGGLMSIPVSAAEAAAMKVCAAGTPAPTPAAA